MMQSNCTPSNGDIVAAARASRASAAAFRQQVERLRDVSFEGTLTAVIEFRAMARAMAAGHCPREAVRMARAAASRLDAPLPMAAE